MTLKPRIVLIPDAVDWILGTWAREIASASSDRYEFIIFPMAEITESPALFRSVLSQSDVVHCLTQWGFRMVRERIVEEKCRHVELISTIHHIVNMSQVEDCINADRIMVVCRKYFDELVAYGIPRERLSLIYNGVDAQFFGPGERAAARSRFGIPDGAFVLGFSGKATSDHDGRKGIDVFCRVLAQLPDRVNQDIHAVLTGPGWETLQGNSTFQRVVFHHFPFLERSRMPDFYNAIDVYLVTARVEGGPAPLLEAMSCGRPVVTTPVGTALDFVRDGENGLTVAIDDVDKTIAAVQRIYRDHDLATRLGAGARETILQNLQWRRTLLNIESLYGKPDRSGVRTTDAGCWEKLSSELITRDSARWRRAIARGEKQGTGTASRGGQYRLRRLCAKAIEVVRRCC